MRLQAISEPRHPDRGHIRLNIRSDSTDLIIQPSLPHIKEVETRSWCS
jgi:hypothetical protein